MPLGVLPPEGQSLVPLDSTLRSGLLAITVLSCISFFSAATLFIYLTYKIVAWQLFVRRENEKRFRHRHHGEDGRGPPREVNLHEHQPGHEASTSQHAVDFTLGIDGVFASRPSVSKDASVKVDGQFPQEDNSPPLRPMKGSPNQFLILIYNLLIADLHQSIAFALNSTWINRNAILVDTKTCWAQGFFVSTGDLSSSMFIMLVAVHTFFSVVKGYRPSQRLLYLSIGLVWLFVYFISALPIAITNNGREHGGFFVRAGAWCWMNAEYERLRLFTHYLWIFIALAVTSALYIAIWYSLRKQTRLRRAANPDGAPDPGYGEHNPAFLIYAVIYVTCTLPLATERVASMSGADIPLGWFCFAGALISLNGFFDCLLFGTTRHSIIFASKYDLDAADTGVKTIAFLQTPKARRYGNMIWIQGGEGSRRKMEPKTTGGWWSWQRLAGQPNTSRQEKRRRPRGSSQESLRGPGIQMDLVTTVVVEVEDDKERDIRFPDPAASASPSVNSTERDATSARAI
ncbi:G-protein coupled receptor [Trichoderma citrinoviride]|uniref:G-protein coupled receptor n=1 Tax=Trichoderma citrinoviride TaxID=58853 RepID=A0A2T4BMB2_9HYPO|nr:G-protein coupled receptor [Trichoderma citrinoviride]PTB70436.1 G-protein coupled receptor [Trichoderma citrinoviride]